MIGALLYYLHRHVRLVLIVAGLGLMFGVGVMVAVAFDWNIGFPRVD